jgi:hypothetical protein
MEDKIEDGGPVYPCRVWEQVSVADIGGQDVPTFSEVEHYGIKLRDWFAGQALTGLLAHVFEDGGDFLHNFGPAAAAQQSYRMADAMIKARKACA